MKVPYAVAIPIQCPDIGIVQAIKVLPVEFVEVEDSDGIWWVSLSPNMYENLSRNMADVTRYIKEKVAESDYFKECIEKSHEKVDKPSVDG